LVCRKIKEKVGKISSLRFCRLYNASRDYLVIKKIGGSTTFRSLDAALLQHEAYSAVFSMLHHGGSINQLKFKIDAVIPFG
jgi:hypothetical protein